MHNNKHNIEIEVFFYRWKAKKSCTDQTISPLHQKLVAGAGGCYELKICLPDPVASVAMMRRLEQMMTTSNMRMITAWVKFSAVRMTSVTDEAEPGAPLDAAPMDD